MNEHYKRAEANINTVIVHLKLLVSDHNDDKVSHDNYGESIDYTINKLIQAKGFVEVGKYADEQKGEGK